MTASGGWKWNRIRLGQVATFKWNDNAELNKQMQDYILSPSEFMEGAAGDWDTATIRLWLTKDESDHSSAKSRPWGSV